MHMAAIEDAEKLVAWAEPNATVVAYDDALSEVVLRALGQPLAPELRTETPLLRYADGRPALPLLEALLADEAPRGRVCDRCGRRGEHERELWVPAGRSVVVVTCCLRCMLDLEHPYDRHPLVWRRPTQEAA